MKITKSQLREMIKEAVLKEQTEEQQSYAQVYRMALSNLDDAFMRLNSLRKQVKPNRQILDAMDKIDAAIAQVQNLIRDDDDDDKNIS